MEEVTVPVAFRDLAEELFADEVAVADLVGRLGRVIRAKIPEYAALPAEVVEAGVQNTLLAASASIKQNRLAGQAELTRTVQVIVDRARSGVSLAAILDAYHRGADEFWTVFSEFGRARGVADVDLLVMLDLVRRWIDQVTVAAASAYHEVGVEQAREEEARKGAALRALLDQPVASDVVAVYLVQLGLDPAGSYAVVRGRLAGDASAATLRALFTGQSAAVAVGQGEVIGLQSEPVEIPGELGVFGVGPVRPAVELYDSAAAAGRAFAAAAQLGRTGAHTLEELRLAAVAATDTEVAAILSERLLAPLRARGRYGGDIWRSVVRYLDSGLRIDETAAALHIHPNTLRHRLAQFSTMTGASLHDPADIAEVWWLATIEPATPR